MDDVDGLIERLGEVRCASCGVRYTRGAIRGVGYEDDCWFVYVTCLSCGRQGIGVAIARRPQPAAAPGPRPLSVDDVLDAHELLGRYGGDVHGLFASALEHRTRS